MTEGAEHHFLARPREDAGEDRALAFQRPQHALLNAVARHQIEDLHRAVLAHAVNAGDALFQHGRVPRHFEIDDRVGGLQVQPGAARIGAEEDATRFVVAEALDQAAPRLAGDVAVQDHMADGQRFDHLRRLLEHHFPLAEHDDLVRPRTDQLLQ